MVANLRCNELKEEAIEKVKQNIQYLKDASERSLIEGFSEKCLAIIQQAVVHYEEYAKQYDKNVFEKTKKDLGQLLLGQLFLCFDNQMKLIRKQIFDKFDKELRKHS